MKNRELLSLLNQFDLDSTIICGVYNGFTDTYGVVDYTWEDYYDRTIYNDLYGTPGQIDKRLLDKELRNPNSKIIYLGSEFPYNHGFGDKDINYNIQSLNDDPDYLWKANDFEWVYDEDGPYWSYMKIFEEDNDGNYTYELINYFKNKNDNWYTCEIHKKTDFKLPPKKITLINPGIEELRNAMQLLDFEKKIIA